MSITKKISFCIKYKILYYDRIDVSEGIDVDKTSESKDHDMCHYWYFCNKQFKFQTMYPKDAMIY